MKEIIKNIMESTKQKKKQNIKAKKAGGLFTKAAALMMAFSLSLSFAGCGKTNEPSQGSSLFGQAVDGEGTSETGMGRYVERTVFELGEGGKYAGTRLKILADGRIEICNNELGVYLSEDGGENWKQDANDLLAEFANHGENYIIASGVSSEGVIALCYSPSSEEGLVPYYVLLYPDGTQKSFDIELSEAEHYVRDFAFDESGRLFAAVFGDSIYEVDLETGSAKEFVKMSGSKVYLQCKNHILLCAVSDGVYLYDMENDKFVEDEVLQDFIKENYGIIEFNDGYNSVKVFLGEEGVLYIAGKKGLHRHVIGGGAIEQMIDGNLSSFGDPSHGVLDAVLMDNQEFLVQYSDLKTVKFTYDATVSTVPQNSLKVYSLKENSTVRQAVSIYQTANPDVYVNYEVGMEEGITREDALKALNTKILEGSGPDVLILDDMPVSSYIDKGILMELSSVVDGFGGEQKLFYNLIKPFYQGESLYEVPAEFMLPMICGEKKALEGADDYSGIADAVEALRKEAPDKRLMPEYSEKGIMKKFMMACEPSWKNEKGEIRKEQLEEFLYQSKRIYDAVREGVPEEIIEAYVLHSTGEMEDGIAYVDSIYFYTMAVSTYIVGEAKLMCGAVSDLHDYAGIISLPKIAGNEDVEFKVMNGQSKNVYMPMTRAGINASAKNPDLSVSFLQTLLSDEVQDLTHYGYPINRQSFENKFVVNEEWVSPDGAFGYYSMGDQEGNMIEWEIYLPDEMQMQMLRDYIAKADTPYIPDSVLEDAVYTVGAEYLRGDKELDAAVKDIMDKVEIYLAE